MKNILSQICSNKLEELKRIQKTISSSSIRSDAECAPDTLGFKKILSESVIDRGVGLIAEIKKSSPSRGIIRDDFDPVDLALQYETGGASCISVLTERNYFSGHNEHLIDVRKAVKLPILRKDFILDPYQVYETRAIGADCILLIMAAIDDSLASDLSKEARRLGLCVLVEVHDERELERTCDLDVDLIGINNRNLKTLEINLNTTERLMPLVPKGIDVVSESGIYSNEDIVRMLHSKVGRFLVGESLMKQNDLVQATRQLLGNKN